MSKELSIKDVMVGNWVDVRNAAAPNTPHIEKLTPSHFLREEKWYGIPLTPEIVEKNGLSRCVETDYVLAVDFKDDKVGVTAAANNAAVGVDYREVIYVHELQLILCVLGIKIDIDLGI